MFDSIFDLLALLTAGALLLTIMAAAADMPHSRAEFYDRMDAWYERLCDRADDFYDAYMLGEFDLKAWVNPDDSFLVTAWWTAKYLRFRLDAWWVGQQFAAWRVINRIERELTR